MHKKYKLGILLALINICILFMFLKGIGFFYNKFYIDSSLASRKIMIAYLEDEIGFLYNLKMKLNMEASGGLGNEVVSERIVVLSRFRDSV